MNFYKHHLGDYAAATSHLSWDEDCAYRRLIDQYYKREAPIPVDMKEACRLVRASTPTQRRAVETVLREFFVQQDDGWHQKRCDEELAAANAQAETNRRIAEEREAKRRARIEHESFNARGNESSTNRSPATIGEREPSQTPDSTSQTPDSNLNTNTSNLPVAPALPPEDRPALVLGETPPKPWEPPDCPHTDVLALWAEVLPAMPQHLPSQWRGARADHLRTRWRETATEKRWQSAADGLAYLRKLFAYVGQSQFLTGRTPSRDPNKRPFVIELEWLVTPSNWAKVLEGKYHQEAA